MIDRLPAHVESSPSRTLLAKLPGAPIALHHARDIAWPAIGTRLIDTGTDGVTLPTDRGWTIHILAQRDEHDAHVSVRGAPVPIAPGDTMTVDADARCWLSGGQLAVLVESESALAVEPHHGVESFDGYNRRTRYETPPGFTLDRWKLTQPLNLQRCARTLIGISGTIGVASVAGSDVLRPGDAVRQTGDITLIPGGLAYVLSLTPSAIDVS